MLISLQFLLLSVQDHVAKKHAQERLRQCLCEVEGKFSDNGVFMCYQKELAGKWVCLSPPEKVVENPNEPGHDNCNERPRRFLYFSFHFKSQNHSIFLI